VVAAALTPAAPVTMRAVNGDHATSPRPGDQRRRGPGVLAGCLAAAVAMLATGCSSSGASPSAPATQHSSVTENASATQPPAIASLAPFVGSWYGHGRGLDISTTGGFTLAERTYAWCSQGPPPCDTMSGNTITDGDIATGMLTSASGDRATGTVTRTTDKVATPLGTIILTLDQSADMITLNGRVSFCGLRARLGACGA